MFATAGESGEGDTQRTQLRAPCKSTAPQRGKTGPGTVVPAVRLSSAGKHLRHNAFGGFCSPYVQPGSGQWYSPHARIPTGLPTLRHSVLSYGGATGEALLGVTEPVTARHRPVRNSPKQAVALCRGTRVCRLCPASVAVADPFTDSELHLIVKFAVRSAGCRPAQRTAVRNGGMAIGSNPSSGRAARERRRAGSEVVCVAHAPMNAGAGRPRIRTGTILARASRFTLEDPDGLHRNRVVHADEGAPTGLFGPFCSEPRRYDQPSERSGSHR